MYDTQYPSASTDRSAEFDARLATVLSNPTRKRILAALISHGTLSLSELARLVSDPEDASPVHASTGDEEHPTTVMLYHRDIPKLADYGIVEWENELDRVALTSDGAACAASLGL